jgi:hypothetical protein
MRTFVGLVGLLVAATTSPSAAAGIQAGVAKVDATLPVGVPLAVLLLFVHVTRCGAGLQPRTAACQELASSRPHQIYLLDDSLCRRPGSHLCEGADSRRWQRRAVGCVLRILLFDVASVCFVTLDGIGMDGGLANLSYSIAQGMGFSVPQEKVIMSGSHSHSGPGAVSGGAPACLGVH